MRLLALILTLFLSAQASPLESFAEEYREGLALVDQADYAELYATTTDRSLRILSQAQEDDIILALYESAFTREGERVTQRGVAAFWLRDGAIYHVDFATLEGVDPAMAGQAADIATTAAGLSQGLAEGNPVVAGALSSPLGIAAVLGIKLGLGEYAETLPIKECVAAKRDLGTMGWSMAGWNLGMLALANPVAAIVGAAIAFSLTHDDWRPAFRECALAKLA